MFHYRLEEQGAFKNHFAFPNLADLLSLPAWDLMNQYYIIITSIYKNIIRVLNIILMLWKISFEFQSPASSGEGDGDLWGE